MLGPLRKLFIVKTAVLRNIDITEINKDSEIKSY